MLPDFRDWIWISIWRTRVVFSATSAFSSASSRKCRNGVQQPASCTRSSEPLWYFAAAFITNVEWKIYVSVTIKYTRPRLHFPFSLSFSTCAHICRLMIKYSSLSPSLSVCLLRSLPSLSAVPKCLSDWSAMIDDWTHLTLSGPLSVFSPLSLLFPLPQRQRCLLSNNI